MKNDYTESYFVHFIFSHDENQGKWQILSFNKKLKVRRRKETKFFYLLQRLTSVIFKMYKIIGSLLGTSRRRSTVV